MFSKPVVSKVLQAAFSVTEKAAGVLYDEFTSAVPFTIAMFEETKFDAVESMYVWFDHVCKWYCKTYKDETNLVSELRREVFIIQMGEVFSDVTKAREIGQQQEIFACYLNWDSSDLSELGLFTTLTPDDDWSMYEDSELEELAPFSLA
jgi:adenylate kinase family enzyme